MTTYAKAYMLFGGVVILVSTAAFEWGALSENVDAYRVPPIALFVGLLGLAIWLAGCILTCLRVAPGTLFGAGGLMLIFLPVTASILNHINPALFNVHDGFGGMMAPILACLLGGLIFVVTGAVRLATK